MQTKDFNKYGFPPNVASDLTCRMAQLVNFFTSNSKRTRNSSSDSDHTPAAKKLQPHLPTSEEKEEIELNTSKDSVTMDDSFDLHENQGIGTPFQQNPDWIEKLVKKVSEISSLQKIDSLKLNNISVCSNLVEAKLDSALLELSFSKKKIEHLSKQVETITVENTVLKTKLSEAESY